MKYLFFDDSWRKGSETTFSIDQLVASSVRARQDSPGLKRKDMLSCLLHYRSEERESITDPAATMGCASILVGGSDSTVRTMAHVVDFVSRDGELQDRLQVELDAVFPGTMDDSWIPPYFETSKMPLLNAVLKEVLRVRPTFIYGA